jgi:hypothetical protein
MANTVMELLQKKLEERKKLIVESVGSGVAKDYAEYRDLCGVIRGLTTAQQEIEDLVRKLKDDDDE